MSQFNSITLWVTLVLLLCCSAFFSGSETGMMAINRYRLRYLVRQNNKKALRVNAMLGQTDRLLGTILIGNTFANVAATAVATEMGMRYAGDFGVMMSTIILTLVILIFAESAPKTLAAAYSQNVAFAASWFLSILFKLLYPIVYFSSMVSNSFLTLFGYRHRGSTYDRLSGEELRTAVAESKEHLSAHHQDMLLRVFDLEKMTIDDVMVPRNDVIGIDLDDDWDDILKLLTTTSHSKLPIYRDGIDNVQGILHLRKILHLLALGQLNKERLQSLAQEPYFIPEGTPLNTQLLNFRREHHRSALVVDEYGDIQGFVALEDILEEIVGELTTEVPAVSKYIQVQADGSYLIDGSANVREINRLMNWQLPQEEAKTVSGMITEYLETIPQANICIKLNGYPIEITEVKDNLVKLAKINPQLRVVVNNEE